jgi:hypothetical protein
MDPRNAGTLQEPRQSGAWTTASTEDVACYIQNNGRLVVPDDRVAPLQDVLRNDIRELPTNYGFPERTVPTDAQVEQLVGRITPAGIDTSTVSRLVSRGVK